MRGGVRRLEKKMKCGCAASDMDSAVRNGQSAERQG